MTREKIRVEEDDLLLPMEGDFMIDASDLQGELTILPSMMYKYKLVYADVKSTLMNIDNEIDIAVAEYDQDIRNNPEKYGMAKITEATVLQALKKVDELVQMKKKRTEASMNTLILQGVLDSLEAKRFALHNLTQLATSNMLYLDTTTTSANDIDSTRRKNALNTVGRKEVESLNSGRPLQTKVKKLLREEK